MGTYNTLTVLKIDHYVYWANMCYVIIGYIRLHLDISNSSEVNCFSVPSTN